jgi:hypothetical protein
MQNIRRLGFRRIVEESILITPAGANSFRGKAVMPDERVCRFGTADCWTKAATVIVSGAQGGLFKEVLAVREGACCFCLNAIVSNYFGASSSTSTIATSPQSMN